jgi:hypothetical protein
MRRQIHTQNAIPITHAQADALKQLDDGHWQSLAHFSAHVRVSLYENGLIEDRGPRGMITRTDSVDPRRARESIGSAALDYRITEAGRTVVQAKARVPA